jgi:UDP-glucose:(heptosyl)LPS alpha-1,3-glucosyltransferase
MFREGVVLARNRPMRIALVHKRLDLSGGTEKDLFQTAVGLRDLGHDVHLFCSEFTVEPPKNVTLHRVAVLPLGRTLRLWSFAWLAPRLIEKMAGCDIVVSFGRLLRQDVLRSGGGTHRGFLERFGAEGGWARRLWQWISVYHRSLLILEGRQFGKKGCRTIIAVSAEVRRDIIAHYAVAPDKIHVLYNGVDSHRFHPARRGEARDRVRNLWKIPLDAPLVLFVGSGFRRKGLDRLLSAWKSSALERVFLLVVGADARLDRYQDWAEAVAPGRIIFAGRQEDVENYYAAADLVALPALQEAFGNVVLEALASGLPVLVSREVGAAEVLHGPLALGIVDRADDPEELKTKLLLLLDKSNDGSWSEAARKLGKEHSWKNHFTKLEAILSGSCRVARDTAC